LFARWNYITYSTVQYSGITIQYTDNLNQSQFY
jgi:hypothetical protein